MNRQSVHATKNDVKRIKKISAACMILNGVMSWPINDKKHIFYLRTSVLKEYLINFQHEEARVIIIFKFENRLTHWKNIHTRQKIAILTIKIQSNPAPMHPFLRQSRVHNVACLGPDFFPLISLCRISQLRFYGITILAPL